MTTTESATTPARVRVSVAAERIGCSLWTVHRLIRSGRLRGYRPTGGRGWLYVDALDLERMVAQAEVRATA